MSESSEVANGLAGIYSLCRFEVVAIICQISLYGIYSCLFPIAIYLMVTSGLRSQARKWLLVLTTFAFALSTVNWVLSVVVTFMALDSFGSAVTECFGSDTVSCLIPKVESIIQVASWEAISSNVNFINFIIADGVIVWRAWVLCSDQSKIVLMIPVVMLVINTVVYLTVIAALAMMFRARFSPTSVIPIRILNEAILTHLSLSLFINIYATSIIALKAWRYRKLLMESGIGVRTPRQAIRILAVLVESGLIYILIGVTILVSVSVFPQGASSIFVSVAQQLVAIYPIIVVLLVEKNRTLDSTISSFGTIIDVRGGQRPSQTAEPMSFARGPVLASRGHIDLSTNPSSTDIHISFDHTLEPGGAGIGPGHCKDSDSVDEHTIS